MRNPNIVQIAGESSEQVNVKKAVESFFAKSISTNILKEELESRGLCVCGDDEDDDC